jgi:hypothetical protein
MTAWASHFESVFRWIRDFGTDRKKRCQESVASESFFRGGRRKPR